MSSHRSFPAVQPAQIVQARLQWSMRSGQTWNLLAGSPMACQTRRLSCSPAATCCLRTATQCIHCSFRHLLLNTGHTAARSSTQIPPGGNALRKTAAAGGPWSACGRSSAAPASLPVPGLAASQFLISHLKERHGGTFFLQRGKKGPPFLNAGAVGDVSSAACYQRWAKLGASSL